MAFQQKHGAFAFQAAMTGGQYTHPNGLFFGGQKPTWSNETIRRILKEHVSATTKRPSRIDFHTGLEPMGYGEPIFIGTDGFGSQERPRAVSGPNVQHTNTGQ